MKSSAMLAKICSRHHQQMKIFRSFFFYKCYIAKVNADECFKADSDFPLDYTPKILGGLCLLFFFKPKNVAKFVISCLKIFVVVFIGSVSLRCF